MAVDDEIRRRKKIVLLGLLVTLFLLTAGALPLMTRQERTPTATVLVGIDPVTPAGQPNGLTPVTTLVPSNFEATTVATLPSRTTAASQSDDEDTPSPTGQAGVEPAESDLDHEGRERDERDERATTAAETVPANSTAESEPASPTAEVTAITEGGATAETESDDSGLDREGREKDERDERATAETEPDESTAESGLASPTIEVTAGATATTETGSSESIATSELPASAIAETTAEPQVVAEATADPADELRIEPPEADPNIAEHMRGEMDEPAQSDNQTILATAANAWPEDSRAEAIALAKEAQPAGDSRPALADIPPENLPITGVRMAQTNWGIIGLAFGIVFLLALFGMAAVGSTTDQPG